MGNIFLLALISFFTDVHSEIIMSILPLFMVEELKMGRTGVGVIEGISDAMTSFLKLWSGWISDRTGRRKPFVAGGYIISAVAKSFIAFVKTPFQLLIIRVIDRVGKGIRTSPRDALISDSVSVGIRGKAFGIHRAADTMGAIVGSAVAIIGLSLFRVKIRTLFLYAILAGVISSFLTFFVREIPPNQKTGKSSTSHTTSTSSPKGKTNFFFLIHTVFTMGNLSYAFYLLKIRDAGFPAELVPAGYLLYNIVYTAISYPAGVFSDRVGGFRVLLGGYFLFILVNGIAMFTSSVGTGILLMFMYGVAMGVTEATGRRAVADLSKSEERGRAYGVFHFLIGMVVLPANAIVGYLWDRYGSEFAFLFGGIMSLLSFIMMIWFLKLQKR